MQATTSVLDWAVSEKFQDWRHTKCISSLKYKFCPFKVIPPGVQRTYGTQLFFFCHAFEMIPPRSSAASSPWPSFDSEQEKYENIFIKCTLIDREWWMMGNCALSSTEMRRSASQAICLDLEAKKKELKKVQGDFFFPCACIFACSCLHAKAIWS